MAQELKDTSLFTDANLVSYYRFEGDAVDVKGNYNGSASNVTFGTSYGKFSQGGLFNGSSSVVDCGNVNVFGGNFSLSVWVKRAGVGTADYIFGKGVAGTDTLLHAGFLSTNELFLAFYGDDIYTTEQFPDTNNWHLITFTYNYSTKVKSIYYDGVLVKQATGTGNPNFGTYSLLIGNSPVSNTYFNGNIDDVCIFSKVLTVTEIGYLYNIGIKKIMGVERNSIRKLNKLQLSEELFCSSLFSDANLIAYYRFNSGALTTDSKGSYTLTNNNSVNETTGKFGIGADFGSSNSTKYFSRNDGVFTSQNKTLSLWVKLNVEISSGEWQFAYSYNKTDGREHGISYQYNSGTRRLRFNCSKADVATQDINYNTTLGTSSWHNIVLTFNGSVIKAYLDGSPVGELNSTGNGSTGYLDVFGIGNILNVTNRNPGGAYASAIIDDVALFSRALTATEVLSLYTSQIKKFMGVNNL